MVNRPRFELLDDSGTPLGSFDSKDEALAALDHLIERDPDSRLDAFVAEFDVNGDRVGTFLPEMFPPMVAGGLIVTKGSISLFLGQDLHRLIRS